tara:strand:+ start:3475 stop:3891 length:417 start_codon:yes stop_codon:yes gene_type:complete
MKQLLITIAALVLVGCGESQQSGPSSDAKPELESSKPTDDSGNYIMFEPGTQGAAFSLILKPDGAFQGVTLASRDTGDPIIGSWKVDGELLVCEGSAGKSTEKTVIKFNKTTGKVVSVNSGGKEVPTEELDLLKVKKN